ncbi:MAG: type II toxin-antitoxin system RelE/ParE family toxin [Microlunatus sp.]
MRNYRLSPKAQRDLASIWDYTEEHWGADQAETYVREIGAAVERIADDPRRGHRCDDVRKGYRQYGIGSHVLFYLESDDAVDVIRILHQRMDPARHL